MKAQFLGHHASIGATPKIVSVFATDAISTPRFFFGAGAPSNTTLGAGNGKYNGITNGYGVSISLVAPGIGYAVGDIVEAGGGVGTPLQITIDAVDAAGAILDWHVSRIGTYNTYPNVLCPGVGGSGNNATMFLNIPPADMYYDVTTPTSPSLYVCTTFGTATSSVWSKVSGGGGFSLFRFKEESPIGYMRGRSWDGTTEGTTDVYIAKPMKLREPASETIDGETYNYSYSTNGDGNRIRQAVLASDSSDWTEFHIVTPRYSLNDIIVTAPLPAGYFAGFIGPPEITLMDVNVDGRAWCGISGGASQFVNL
jgi:hypothetical protein